jgi:hypothetical protein
LNSTELLHLKRWIKASFIKAFRPFVQQSADLFIEGDDRPIPTGAKRLELRIDGPYTRSNGSRGEFCCYIEVNLLCSTTRNEAEIFDRENLQGVMAFMLNRDVCVYKIGNVGRNEADDETLLGVMRLLPMDAIKTSDFGLVDSNTEVYQAGSEAHYEMYFQG